MQFQDYLFERFHNLLWLVKTKVVDIGFNLCYLLKLLPISL